MFEKMSGTPVDSALVANLMSSYDRDGSGSFNYLEFLEIALQQKWDLSGKGRVVAAVGSIVVAAADHTCNTLQQGDTTAELLSQAAELEASRDARVVGSGAAADGANALPAADTDPPSRDDARNHYSSIVVDGTL